MVLGRYELGNADPELTLGIVLPGDQGNYLPQEKLPEVPIVAESTLYILARTMTAVAINKPDCKQ